MNFAIVGVWWLVWSLYVQNLHRRGRIDRLHPGAYATITVVAAALAIALSGLGLLAFTPHSFLITPVGAAIGAAAAAVFWAPQMLTRRRTRNVPGRQQVVQPGLWKWALPLSGASEEVLFRGCLLFGLVATGVPTWASVALTALAFGLAHIFQLGLQGVLIHTLSGLIFGTLAIVLSLGGAVLAHALYNLLALIPVQRRSPETPRWQQADG